MSAEERELWENLAYNATWTATDVRDTGFEEDKYGSVEHDVESYKL